MEYNYNCGPSSTFNSSSSSSSTSRNMSSRKNGGGGGGSKKTSKGGSSSSTVRLSTDPQSVAARERRHRISDRFKILQSMVPGGTKMDTVSMLDEAIQYVKFLKAQIWLHQTMINFADDDPAAGLLPPPACFSSQYEQQTDQFGAVAYSNGMGGAAENLLPPLPPQPPLLPVPEYSCFQAEDIMSNYYDAYTTNYN